MEKKEDCYDTDPDGDEIGWATCPPSVHQRQLPYERESSSSSQEAKSFTKKGLTRAGVNVAVVASGVVDQTHTKALLEHRLPSSCRIDLIGDSYPEHVPQINRHVLVDEYRRTFEQAFDCVRDAEEGRTYYEGRQVYQNAVIRGELYCYFTFDL